MQILCLAIIFTELQLYSTTIVASHGKIHCFEMIQVPNFLQLPLIISFFFVFCFSLVLVFVCQLLVINCLTNQPWSFPCGPIVWIGLVINETVVRSFNFWVDSLAVNFCVKYRTCSLFDLYAVQLSQIEELASDFFIIAFCAPFVFLCFRRLVSLWIIWAGKLAYRCHFNCFCMDESWGVGLICIISFLGTIDRYWL